MPKKRKEINNYGQTQAEWAALERQRRVELTGQSDRAKVVFLHLMKCGGTTLRHLLADEYPAHQIAPVPIKPNATTTPPFPHVRVEPIEHQQAMRPEYIDQYRLVMSHYDFRITKKVPKDWLFMTMLRHPVKQLLSRYFFIQRAPEHGTEWDETCTQGFYYWLKYHAGKYLNHQTELLGMGNVSKAVKLLENPRMTFGLVEHYPQSISLFNAAFGWKLPDPPRYNQAQINTDTYQIDPAAYRLAESLQSKDLELYRRAHEIFTNRIGLGNVY